MIINVPVNSQPRITSFVIANFSDFLTTEIAPLIKFCSVSQASPYITSYARVLIFHQTLIFGFYIALLIFTILR